MVARLRAAGAIVLGKANLSEWANFRAMLSISGWSAVGGQTRCPYDPSAQPIWLERGAGGWYGGKFLRRCHRHGD